jgi:hypothetical protein
MHVFVRFDELGADPGRLEELAVPLRAELGELDVEHVRPVAAGAAPAGTRGVDFSDVAAFIVSLGGSGDALKQVVAVLRAWVSRGTGSVRTVEMTVGDKTIRIGNASPDQQDRMIGEFLRIAGSG